jgi:manganese/zinc/iron transport system substrate-binding protein
MHQVKKILYLLTLIPLLLSACSGQDVQLDSKGQRQLRVVATTGMVADLVRAVGGERVDVKFLMGPGVDPHLYKASEGDLRALEKADIIFYNGLHLEAGLARVLERMSSYRTTVAIGDSIERAALLSPPEFQGSYDPHVWFDVALWKSTIGMVTQTLSEFDPGSAPLYQQNAQRYTIELEALDTYVREQVAHVPPEKRVLITAHDAFNYFGKAYGFEVRGLQGISTASEAGTGDVQALTAFIVERQIPAIFVESSVPQRTIEAVQAAVRAQGFEVEIGGQLFSDALGSPDTSAGTYTGMVRTNVDTIVQALIKK